MATWTAAYVNDLSDSAFLHVEAGGEKKNGKTEPNALRHFPVKDAEGHPDAAHIRNALARIPDCNLPASVKAECHDKAEKMLEECDKSSGKSDEEKPDPFERHMAICEDADLKGKSLEEGEDNGWIEGYACTWGNVDKQNETFKRGCALRSIQQAVPAGKVKLQVLHTKSGGDVLETIGTITEAKEDDRGLWYHAELAGTRLAQDVRKLVNGKHVKYDSIGFGILGFQTREIGGKEVREFTEIRFGDVTVTNRPVNDQAVITASKSLPDDTEGAAPAEPTSAPSASSPVITHDRKREMAMARALVEALG